MSFAPEPAYIHGTPERTAVLLVNLGTPDAPTTPAVRRYLAEFLSDPRVVEIPRLAWWPILHGIVLRARPAKSAAKYATIWTPEGSPLLAWTRKQAKLLTGYLGERGHAVIVREAMRYGEPSIASAMNALRVEGVTRVLLLPLYPQYAAATTASTFDALAAWAMRARRVPEIRAVMQYHDDPGYIEALAASVRAHWMREGRGTMLVMSFHGLPARSLQLGDPYHCQCQVTARLLADRLGLKTDEYRVTFQSRFGKAAWLEPYTEPTLRALAAQGTSRVDVICPGFSADCLETLEEIGVEGCDAFVSSGGKDFHAIACLNADHAWIDALAQIAIRHLQGWPTSAPDPADLQRQAERARAAGAER